MNAKVANMDFFNTAMQVVAGIATIYSLGTDSAATFQKKKVTGIDGAAI